MPPKNATLAVFFEPDGENVRVTGVLEDDNSHADIGGLVKPGEKFMNLTYEELRNARYGSITFDPLSVEPVAIVVPPPDWFLERLRAEEAETANPTGEPNRAQ